MYQNIAFQKSKNIMHVWDDKNGHLQFPFKQYAYKKNAHGRHVALDGSKVDKVTSWDEIDVQRGLIYESDINPETRTLIDLYFVDSFLSLARQRSSASDQWIPSNN